MKKLIVLLLVVLNLLLLSSNAQEVIAVPNDDYYASTAGLAGDDLLEELASITFENHKKFTSYDDLRQLNAYSDPDPNNSSNLLDFYSGISIDATWDGGKTWNREHVWPQSLSKDPSEDKEEQLYGESGAGSDIHHIRPTIQNINSARGNNKYGDLNKTGAKYYSNAAGTNASSSTGQIFGYISGGVFEPLDNVKGDVARIVLYLYMHYSIEVEVNKTFSKSGYKAGKLRLENIIETDGNSRESSLELLVEWNKLDPVDEYEANRNDYCASITGTRNPFIDNEEFLDLICEDIEVAERYGVTYIVDENVSFNYTNNTKYLPGSKLPKPTIDPSLDNYVFAGWYKDEQFSEKWNFDEDIIEDQDIVLYAKFTEETIENILENSKIKSKLSFNVIEEEGSGAASTKTVSIKNPHSGGGTLSKGNYDLSKYYNFDTNLFTIMYKANNGNSSYIKAGDQIRLYPGSGNGSSIEITAKEGVTIKNVTVSLAQYVSPKVTISSDGKTAVIQNKSSASGEKENQSRLNGFEITYEYEETGLVTKVAENSVKLSYSIALTQTQYEKYLLANELSLYINNEKVEYYTLVSGNTYYLVYDILVSNYSTIYTPKFVYNDIVITFNGYSAKSLAKYYFDNLKNGDTLSSYKNCLEQIIG